MPKPSMAVRPLFHLIGLICLVVGKLPDNYKFGVNLGGWLVTEPWMNPMEWRQMGGEECEADRSMCAASEWSLTRKLGQKRANEVFLSHWKSWFNRTHVDRIKEVKLDHVRVPLPFWIVEEIVEAPAELYAQGGWMELKRGLGELNQAGLYVTLDMHAMPGVAAASEPFAGNVTENVQFYQDHNFRRALAWAAILAAMTHLDPDFQSVIGIEPLNEPRSNPDLTPGLGQYYSDFVTIVRSVEYALGCQCEADLSAAIPRIRKSTNVIDALATAIKLIPTYAAKTGRGMDTTPLVSTLQSYLDPKASIPPSSNKIQITTKSCVTTMAMSKRWQTDGDGPSMLPYTIGPAAYHDHLYFSFGGVADPTFDSYLKTMCNLNHTEISKRNGEVPYGHSEFSLKTNFMATEDQLRAWGDAQKFVYNKESFWTFWNFRLGDGVLPDRRLTWSYLAAVDAGLLPKDPTVLFNSSVCDPYIVETIAAPSTTNFTNINGTLPRSPANSSARSEIQQSSYLGLAGLHLFFSLSLGLLFKL